MLRLVVMPTTLEANRLLAKLNAAEAEAASLREQLKAILAEALFAIEVEVRFSRPELALSETTWLIFPSYFHNRSHAGFVNVTEHYRPRKRTPWRNGWQA